jgi:hypothetical protein
LEDVSHGAVSVDSRNSMVRGAKSFAFQLGLWRSFKPHYKGMNLSSFLDTVEDEAITYDVSFSGQLDGGSPDPSSHYSYEPPLQLFTRR